MVPLRLFGVTAPIPITSSNTAMKLWWKENSFAIALTASTFFRVA